MYPKDQGFSAVFGDFSRNQVTRCRDENCFGRVCPLVYGSMLFGCAVREFQSEEENKSTDVWRLN